MTYSDLLIIYNETKSETLQTDSLGKESKNNYLCNINKTTEWLKGIYGYIDYEKGLDCAKMKDKHCLIYFNGYGSVSSRKVEANILLNQQISEIIKKNYVLIILVTDDVSKLATEQKYFSEKLNKLVTKKGEKNLDLQIDQFNSDIQPLFIITDKFGNEI